MDFKTMKDSELAMEMVSYISRVEQLLDIIRDYLDKANGKHIPAEKIREQYKQLKYELRESANYLNKVRNHNGSVLYKSAFSPSIREAAAFGFNVPINSSINQLMFNAVAEAHYRMTKYYNMEEWGKLI